METTFFSFALALLLLNNLALTTFSNLITDQSALLAFKDAITSDPDGVLSKNWSTSTSICSWIGLSCGIKHNRVTALNVSGFGLEGTIAPHIGNLSFLRSLDVSSNNFTGFIPSELFNLHRLKEMNFEGNQIMGSIPNDIFNISSLIEINLRFNGLSDKLPNDICSSTIPKLKYIYLTGNQLSGEIPTNIYKCRELEDLRLADNQFSGNIPSEIGSLTVLRTLSLYSNGFTGSIPKQVGNLTSLKYLDLAFNKLTGELPEELGNLAHLEVLAAPFNDHLSGSIPSSIFNISTLKKIVLQQNNFSGSLPSNMGLSLPNLEALYLFFNRLGGEIPSSITNASKLTVLELNKNSFIGSIPDFGNLRNLKILRLWENNLTGAESPTQELRFLSSLTNCQDLEFLEIKDNPLNGILPASIGNLSTSLLNFAASNCKINGAIPSEIGNLRSLLSLDLSENQLTRNIPTTLGKLKQLQQIYIGGNQLQGYIPQDLCQLINLGELNLSANMLTGPIHECLGNLKRLKVVSLASNKLNFTIPSNFWNLVDLVTLDLSSNDLSGQLSSLIGSWKAIDQLDLSFNHFSGDIPSSIECCLSLEYLSLGNNQFTGSIPKSLGNVRGLTTLDLSNNDLSGLIPESLEDLPDLENFSVSYNKLEGKIPNGGCFANFAAQSFVNNSALCGAARFHVPPCKENHGRSRSKSIALIILQYIEPPIISAMILWLIIIMPIGRLKQTERPASAYIPQYFHWRRISYRELERGTSSFSETNLLGRGSFGSVYKGTLSDGLKVAVKVFNLQLEGATKSFDTESEILRSVRHRNLVRIIGCCTNTEFKALILAYMPNGSLEKWLYLDNYHLDLVQRLNIAIDVAFALEYLHHGHTFTVVHCDIKPSNVLLDEDMIAHVGDFGIAKLFDEGEAIIQTKTLATIGYAAPEYGSEGKVSTNGDVYSYGIMLLEIFTKKKPTNDIFSGEMSLKKWVSGALQENAISEVVAPDLLSREDRHFSAKEQCVSSIFDLAMKCLAFSPHERINMIQVVAALQKIKAKVTVEGSKICAAGDE